MTYKTPPSTPFVCVVGVTGHRDLAPAGIPAITKALSNILAAVRQQISSQLAHVSQGLFSPCPPLLRCVSPLAEGADRIVAHQALEQGYQLQVPLPFWRTEYEEDFNGEPSKQEFRDLLGRATAVLELDGTRDAQDDAYLAVGRIVLEQSDLLLAVWDGAKAKGLGGTGQVVAEAQLRGIPVIVVAPSNPTVVRFVSPCATDNWEHDLKVCIGHLLLPPAAPTDSPCAAGTPAPSRLKRLSEFLLGAPPTGTSPQLYYAETWKHPSLPNALLGAFSSWFERILSFRWPVAESQTCPRPGFGQRFKTGRQWFARLFARERDVQTPTACVPCPWCDGLGLDGDQPRRVERILAEHYVWADHLALYYSARFRALGFLRHLLMAVVICGLFLGIHMESLKGLGFALQFLAFLAILGLVRLNRRRDWHQRFLDYRYLAEHLRHMHYLVWVGRTPEFAHEGADRDCDMEEWPAWHLRNVFRQAGLVDAALSSGALASYRRLLEAKVINSQLDFFTARQQRYETIASRLEVFGMVCFIGGLLFILLRAAIFLFIEEKTTLLLGFTGLQLRTLMNEIALVIPALASMMFALRSQGEYPRLADRYKHMHVLLVQQRVALDKIAPVTTTAIGNFAEGLAQRLSSEVSGWHVLVKAKGLTPY